MNTMNLSEAAAIATMPVVEASASTAAPRYEGHLVPLSVLRPSARNARRGGGTAIPELAASIERVGLLHNLVVVPQADGRHFEVVAGQRRLAALTLLAKRRRLAKDFGVPCVLVPDSKARTVSLTENVQREAMHPADQFEAFAALATEGQPIEDIAATFGVTPLVVQRRLRLANVSPRLLADYRAGSVSLEQLMALAFTDDHAAQEAAFYESPNWQRSPENLRERLAQEAVSADRDSLAQFVGVAAYEAAGGSVRRDLFSEEGEGAYLTDPALLDRLARDKLASSAEAIRAEGWAWVDVVPRATYADLHAFQRAPRDRRQPGKAEAKRAAKLDAEQDSLQERLDDPEQGLTEEEADALHARLDGIGEELEAIEQSLTTYSPEIIAKTGAVVSVDHSGAVVAHRGLLRAEQAEKRRAVAAGSCRGAGDGENGAGASRPGLSEKLVRRLSAHRTAALQAEVARHPQIALVALVHRLARRLLCDGYEGSPINISATSHVDSLGTHALDVEASPAAIGLREVREAWAARLPNRPADLFDTLVAMPQEDLMGLLAVCVASTVGAICSREDEAPASLLARHLGLDMHAWWKPTAAGYFEHVSKGKALEAIRTVAPEQVSRLAKLKKADLASEAERLVAGTGWLPAMLCMVDADEEPRESVDAAGEGVDEGEDTGPPSNAQD